MKLRGFLVLVIAVAVLYFSAAAYLLHFEIDRFLFPSTPSPNKPTGSVIHKVIGRTGNVMLIRRYGAPQLGCVVFFPGQHGGISSYEKNLFPSFMAKGIAVFALTYPGQDDASGRSELSEVQNLTQQALSIVGQTCTPGRTVFVGRSLGAMLAAYAAGVAHPAGLVLDAATPSLSSALVARLRSRWYLAPIAQLPVSRLLSHDYTLMEALSASTPFPVIVFQGTADEQTPIEALRATGAIPEGSRLLVVQGGTHSNTYLLALDAYVQSVLDMFQHTP
ncbi:MAG: alpha/beta hydrolase [Rhodoferax sp.]|uniref:alpha/beta fold hydrolase n=1 Tax=Rhodoferax sp. TaxID=50421 RepID=UPI00261DF06E|nr:alpha/beta hydrolase [Rhodoferax sp.]MDD2878809.1 alpha/beta hydrolase [Rhodoferax sp.]